jgi:hypothetical protein
MEEVEPQRLLHMITDDDEPEELHCCCCSAPTPWCCATEYLDPTLSLFDQSFGDHSDVHNEIAGFKEATRLARTIGAAGSIPMQRMTRIQISDAS